MLYEQTGALEVLGLEATTESSPMLRKPNLITFVSFPPSAHNAAQQRNTTFKLLRHIAII